MIDITDLERLSSFIRCIPAFAIAVLATAILGWPALSHPQLNIVMNLASAWLQSSVLIFLLINALVVGKNLLDATVSAIRNIFWKGFTQTIQDFAVSIVLMFVIVLASPVIGVMLLVKKPIKPQPQPQDEKKEKTNEPE